MTAPKHPHLHHDPGFVAIALFKLAKAALLVAFGAGTLTLLNQHVMKQVSHWAHLMALDQHSHIVQDFLLRLGVAQRRDVVLASGTAFFYAALLLTEGIGLLREKVWAEYLTFVITVSFMPVEVYGMVHHLTHTRIVVFLLNSLVTGYLAWRLDQRARARARLKA